MPMESPENTILERLSAGRFVLTVHAATRMRERAIAKADIQACGRTAKTCRYQAAKGTYRVEGEDLCGESLTVICVLLDGLLIVSLF